MTIRSGNRVSYTNVAVVRRFSYIGVKYKARAIVQWQSGSQI